jgi:dUTP pyrophosphatase
MAGTPPKLTTELSSPYLWECVGGCGKKTNGSQYCRKTYCPKERAELERAWKARHTVQQERRLGGTLRVQKLTDYATIPTRETAGAAGYDLYAAYDVTIPPQGKSLVKTDIAVALPRGCYGRIAPRSGLAWNHHLDVGAGVIDADYRGSVDVVMFNHGAVPYVVKRGDRVAQFVLECIKTPAIVELKSLDKTTRGDGGFGYTGY